MTGDCNNSPPACYPGTCSVHCATGSAEPAAEAEHAPESNGYVVPAAPTGGRRFWIHANLTSSPGALGFYLSAKRELLGDPLRLLLNYDLPAAIPPVTGAQQPLSGVDLHCLITLRRQES